MGLFAVEGAALVVVFRQTTRRIEAILGRLEKGVRPYGFVSKGSKGHFRGLF